MLERSEELADCGLLGILEKALQAYEFNTEMDQILTEHTTRHRKKRLEEWPSITGSHPLDEQENSALLLVASEVGFGSWQELKEKIGCFDERFPALGLNFELVCQPTKYFKRRLLGLLERLKGGKKKRGESKSTPKKRNPRARSKSVVTVKSEWESEEEGVGKRETGWRKSTRAVARKKKAK